MGKEESVLFLNLLQDSIAHTGRGVSIRQSCTHEPLKLRTYATHSALAPILTGSLDYTPEFLDKMKSFQLSLVGAAKKSALV
jgi:hypothetical protein